MRERDEKKRDIEMTFMKMKWVNKLFANVVKNVRDEKKKKIIWKVNENENENDYIIMEISDALNTHFFCLIHL